MDRFGSTDDMDSKGLFMFPEERDTTKAMMVLDSWRAQVEAANRVTDELTEQAVQQEEAKAKAHGDMTSTQAQLERYHEQCTQATLVLEGELLRLQKDNKDLMDRLKGCNDFLEFTRNNCMELAQRLTFSALIPDTKLKFSEAQKEDGDNDDGQFIRGFYTITQKPNTVLRGGQALITFEDKKVASQVLKMARCPVPCGLKALDVRPKSLTLEGPAVKFAIHLDVSKKELKFSGLWSTMPPERVRDRLECSFSRPSRGGGEVDKVEYDHDKGTGKVIFLHTGVADRLALIGQYCVDLDKEAIVKVETDFNYSLERFQMFSPFSERSILLDNIRGVDKKDEEEVPDMLEIFFQKPNNSGGEIETLHYHAEGQGELLALFDVI